MENKEHTLLTEGFHTGADYIDRLYKTGHVIELGGGQYYMRWNRKRISTGLLSQARYFGTEQEATAFVYESLCFIGLNPFVCRVSWFLVSYEQKDGRDQYWSGKDYIPDIHMAIPFTSYQAVRTYQEVNSLKNAGYADIRCLRKKQVILAA